VAGGLKEKTSRRWSGRAGHPPVRETGFDYGSMILAAIIGG
jgi:hypothetical protein